VSDPLATESLSVRQKVVHALMANGLQVPEFSSEQAFKRLDSGEFVICEPKKNRDGDADNAIEIYPIMWQKRLVS
jgi:hypothetical protein